MLLIVDIDGTIANAEKRFKEAGPEPDKGNKEAYLKWLAKVQNQESLGLDPVVPGMQFLLTALANPYGALNPRIVYLTSREEKYRMVTKDWLTKHNFPNALLVMRPNDCWDSSADFKASAIALLRNGEEVLVLDDDEHGTIETMCKKNGYTFLKARSGGQR